MAHQPHPRSRGEGQGPPLGTGGETIAAIATPPGRGGIGVVRVSGAKVAAIAQGVTGRLPVPRQATLCDFRTSSDALIDQGLALYFPAPASYTGEDVLELQGHGGPMVMRQLLSRCLELGARVAEPGEFTRRAFLNERIDLAQAESVADLIDASSVEAALSAARSLAGDFSARIHELVEGLTWLRAHVEACIDFPEEDIDPADRERQAGALFALIEKVNELLAQARQGLVLREGLTVVLVGRPNVGKSSLLNRLAGADLAIVTPIAGTTRDYVRATIDLEGVPIHLIDTAGLREARDDVERIGVERAWQAAAWAGAVIFVADEEGASLDAELEGRMPRGVPQARVVNKIDLSGAAPGRDEVAGVTTLHLSARTGAGVEALRSWLLEVAGWKPHGEGLFMARARHLHALEEARDYLCAARLEPSFELKAEELRLAQVALGRITGVVTADALLGEIFGSFCIGK